MRAWNLEDASRTARRSEHDIDAYHGQFKRDTWESQEPLELLIDFENFAE